jgi:polyhydroxyalkanoate synthesis regulator phasin
VDRRRKRIATIGAAVALAAAGGGAAYAAATGGDQQQAFLNDAAQRLHVSSDQLRAALEGALGDQLDQAVKDGKVTREQADRIQQQAREHGLPLGAPPLDGPRFFMAAPGPGGPFGIALDAAADYLGLTRAQLGRAMMSGRSLADVARAQGKSVDGLEQALVDAAKDRLDRAVADGKLTSDQRDEILRELQEHVADLVTHAPPGPGARGAVHVWRGGPDGPGGMMRGHGGPPPPWDGRAGGSASP